MLNAILAALRSSEFWIFAAGVLMESLRAPVPDEFKVFGGLYVGFRVVSKVAKYIFPNGTAGKWFKNDAAVGALLFAFLAAPASAQVPITDVAQRLHVQASGGAMVLTTGEDWSGASLGGTVLYNLHQQFSVFGGYDHGFPINDVDEPLDLWRAVGSVRVHPNVFVGFGYAWFEKGIEGGLTQLVVTKQIAPRVALGGLYAHVFARDQLDDFEYARVYLNYHLLGKE